LIAAKRLRNFLSNVGGVSPHNPANLQHPKYRADIDGLRGIAILCVVFYHACPEIVTGGYIGVDIFFVISGFLITEIIVGNLNRGTFSFAEFYARRIRRIFPALSVMLIAVIVFGWFELFADEYRQLGKHVAAGAGFVSNIILWQESGYFDRVSETKPLLHLWSLGIEEQFYIVWPLLLVIFRKRLSLTLIIFIAIASFAMNVKGVHRHAAAVFYLPWNRAWELMLGAMLACVSQSRLAAGRGFSWARAAAFMPEASHLRSLVGAALIVAALLLLRKTSAFPGWWALLPTLGAVLIISAGRHALVNRILARRYLVWIGLISYPLYLWHWPLLSYLRILKGETPGPIWRAGAIMAALMLAVITYKLVEIPVRFSPRGRLATGTLLALMILIGGAGYLVFRDEGVPARAAASTSLIQLQLQRAKVINDYAHTMGERSCFELPAERSQEWFGRQGCLTLKYPGRPVIFLMGDSHSASLALGLRPFADKNKINFLQMSSGWCTPFSNTDDDCQSMNRFVREQIRAAKPDILIVDGHWLNQSTPVFFSGGGNFMRHLEAGFQGLAALGARHMVVIGQMPTWQTDLPDILQRKYLMNNVRIPIRTFADIEPESLQMDERMKEIAYPPNTTYISLKDMLCDRAGCLITLGPDLSTQLVVWDYGHLTPAAAKFVTDQYIQPILLRLVEK